MVKGITTEELDLEILEFLDSLSNAGIRIPAKHVVKKEILQEIIQSEKDFDYVTFKHRKHETKIQFNDRGFDTLRIDVEEFIPL